MPLRQEVRDRRLALTLAAVGCLSVAVLVVPSARLALAVVLFAALVASNHLIEGMPAQTGPTRSAAFSILSYTQAAGADHGYAPYWDASVLISQTRGELKAFPAIPYGPGLHPSVRRRSRRHRDPRRALT